MIYLVFLLFFNGEYSVLPKCNYLTAYQAEQFFIDNARPIKLMDSFILQKPIDKTGYSDMCGTTLGFETKNWIIYTDDKNKTHLVKIPRD